MVHDIELGSTKFSVHGFDFGYRTESTKGQPTEQGSQGLLKLTIFEAGDDDAGKGTNYKAARSALWKARRRSAVREAKTCARRSSSRFISKPAGWMAEEITFVGWVSPAFASSTRATAANWDTQASLRSKPSYSCGRETRKTTRRR